MSNDMADISKSKRINIGKMIQDLEQAGISIGPNYNLGSPYERPINGGCRDARQTKPLRLRHIKE